MSGHQKHKKIPRTRFGQFSRTELSFLGAPCGEIEKHCRKLTHQSGLNTLYIDAKHGETLPRPDMHVLEYQQDHWRLTLNDPVDDPYAWRRLTDEYDLSLINGNHFEAERQIICLHPKKYDSLKRKKDKLTRPVAMVDFTGQGEIPPELRDFLSEFKDLPIFGVDEMEALSSFVLRECTPSAALRGVVLTGGKSTRMGEDKSMLEYHGKEQWKHVRELLEAYCEDVVVSVPGGAEASDPGMIPDRMADFGPFGGILSCFMEAPNRAHLVVAVDLPFVNKKTLETLIDNRNPFKTATAFLNPGNGFPEPLISIWEPRAYGKMLSFLGMGYTCPRKVLINSDIATAPLQDEKWIRNANTPEERAQVMKSLRFEV